MSFYMLDHPNPNADQGGFPRRGGAQLSGTCIIHTSESVLDVIGPDSTAEDCAAFISIRSDFGCYHDIVDSDSIIEMFPFEWEAWHDSETNNWSVGISAACRTTDWLTMPADRREKFYRNLAWCAADFVKYMKTKGITVPLRRITGTEARNRVPGFCAHGDSGISRTDPGKDFDWAKFFKYTQEALNGTTSSGELTVAEADRIIDYIRKLAYAGWNDDKGASHPGFMLVIEENQKRIGKVPNGIWAFSGARPNQASTTMWNRLVSTHEEVVQLKAEVAAQTELIKQVLAGSGANIDYDKIEQIFKATRVNITIDDDTTPETPAP